MIRFRPKLGSERDSEWRCCCCLHVRTATIILGSWHLMLHLLALGFLAAVVRDPNLLEDYVRDSVPMADWRDMGSSSVMPTPLSEIDSKEPSHNAPMAFNRDHSLMYHDADMGALVTVCTLTITMMMIYGASKGKPAHILPFFCLQIFDFAITVLTATGYLCYLRSIHRLVAETRRLPWREELLSLPAPTLAFVVLSAFLVAILVKAYAISIVWRCYKYLIMRIHAMRSLTPFVISAEGVTGAPTVGPYPSATPPAPDYSSLLPDYEEAVKQAPPPSYRAATLMATVDPSVTLDNNGNAEPRAQPTAPLQPPTQTVVMLPPEGTQARV